MAKRKIEYDKYAAGIFNRTESYANSVRLHFESAVERLLELTSSTDLAQGEVFSFSANNRVSREANEILRNLYSNVYQEIRGGITSEWNYANLSADTLIRSIFGKVADSDHFARYFSRNQQAMDAFFSRTNVYGGLNLSQRVWNYTGQFKDEIELALSVSLGRGDSASTVSRHVRTYLREPERLFRRVKDESGNLKLSKRAAAYHPGRGVYRSSYKNAMRLTRTETNMAYRTADHIRWQQMDFVIGIEIRLSNRHPTPDICDDLKGKYPKDFKFVGWHPQCRCHAVPILAPLDDMLKWGRDVLDGKAGLNDFAQEQITETPEVFNNWVRNNVERIANAKNMPYWVRDNAGYFTQVLSDTGDITELIESFSSIAAPQISNPLSGKLFIDFTGGIATEVAKGVTALINAYYKMDSNVERVNVLRQIVSDKGFKKLRYHSTKDHSIYGIGYEAFDRSLKIGEMPNNLIIAKKMMANGYDVYLLPNSNSSVSADYILVKGDRLYYAEGKTLNGANSLDNRLRGGAKQSGRIIIDVIGTDDARYIASTLRSAFEQESNLNEVILLKGKREIKINRGKAMRKDFIKVMRKLWTRQK